MAPFTECRGRGRVLNTFSQRGRKVMITFLEDTAMHDTPFLEDEKVAGHTHLYLLGQLSLMLGSKAALLQRHLGRAVAAVPAFSGAGEALRMR